MKNLEIKNESGRSMIEMLGVLAIIGVLSVGGIAGYSKAMQRYRINKTIEQITLIAGNVRAFFAPQGNYGGVNNSTILRKAKLVPDEMWNNTTGKFTNVFGQFVYLETAHKSSNTDTQAFMIENFLPEEDYETCIDLLSHDWTAAGVVGIEMTAPRVNIRVTNPVSVDTAVNKCMEISKLGYQIPIKMYFDVNSNCWNETEGNKCS